MPQLNRLRFLAMLVLGFAIVFWLGREDDSVRPVIAHALPAAGLATWLLTEAVQQRLQPAGVARSVLWAGLGAFGGVLAALIAWLLMAIKTSLHAHIYPDYTIADLLFVLRQLPLWVAAGGLAGLGVSLMAAALTPPNTNVS